MKFDMQAKVLGMVFTKMLKKYYKENFPEVDIKNVAKEVNKEYRAIVERTPSIGKTMVSSNLVGASYFFAIAKKVPNMTPELMDKIVKDVMYSDMMVKMYAKTKKKGLLFSEKEQDKWAKDAERSQQSNLDFDWKYTFVKGKDEFSYKYTKCGVCRLAEAENLLDYLPCMCRMDYPKFEIKGAKLDRAHTIANGDGYCDFHLTRIKED